MEERQLWQVTQPSLGHSLSSFIFWQPFSEGRAASASCEVKVTPLFLVCSTPQLLLKAFLPLPRRMSADWVAASSSSFLFPSEEEGKASEMDHKPYPNTVLERSLFYCLQNTEVQPGGRWNSGEGKSSRLRWSLLTKQD